MKVLILITKSNLGGAQRYVYDLATNLPKDSYDVEVMAGGNGPLIEKLIAAGIRANGDLPIGRDVSILKDIGAFFELITLLRNKKPDILHVNSSKIGGLGALAGRIVGIPKIIFTTHGWAFNEDRDIFTKLLIKLSYWIIINLSHITIAVSENTKKQIENWPFISKKVAVIHNGIKVEAIFSKVNARYELSKVNIEFTKILKEISAKNLIIIGSVGELHHIKGYEYALRGIKGLIKNFKTLYPEKKIIYTIIGEGEDRKNIENDIINLELQNSVILFGNIPLASQYVRAFDLFILPSLSEGFPYVLLEAGIAGLPVVATAVGGISEIIDDMKSGVLIQSRKSKEIQHALEFFITHKKIQKEYSLALHEKVLNEFSIEKMLSETIKIYSTNLTNNN